MKPKSDAAKQYYQMNAQEQRVAAKFLARLETEITLPRIKVNGKAILPDHPDKVVGEVLLRQALGTTNSDFAMGIISQLADVGSQLSGKIDEGKTNFLLSVVEGVKPIDQQEAMLAAQMGAIHNATMRVACQFAHCETIQHLDSVVGAFTKLARTFVAQMEALKHYRAGEEQTVNVSVSEGGQAIVGNVTRPPSENASNEPAAASPTALSNGKTANADHG